MTQMHPEAREMLAQHHENYGVTQNRRRIESFSPEYDVALSAISETLHERDALKSAADDVYNRLMPEVQELREKLAQAVDVIRRLRCEALFGDDEDAINAAAKFVKENENG